MHCAYWAHFEQGPHPGCLPSEHLPIAAAANAVIAFEPSDGIRSSTAFHGTPPQPVLNGRHPSGLVPTGTGATRHCVITRELRTRSPRDMSQKVKGRFGMPGVCQAAHDGATHLKLRRQSEFSNCDVLACGSNSCIAIMVLLLGMDKIALCGLLGSKGFQACGCTSRAVHSALLMTVLLMMWRAD